MSETNLFDTHKTAINCWLTSPCAVTTELIAHQGFDTLTIDMQHGLIDYPAALSMLQAMAATSVTPLVRVPWLEPGIIMKMLDAGAMGIICPMIETPEQTREFISYCYYPPAGHRSYGPFRAALCHGEDYPAQANHQVMPIVMIETRQALDNLDKILQEPGLGGVYIGPFDLSYALGCTPQPDNYEPPVLEAIDHILARCQHFSIPAAIHCITARHAVKMRNKGFSLVTAGMDVNFIKTGTGHTLRIWSEDDKRP